MEYKSPIKTIRAHCLDCSGGSSKEVGLCQCTTCILFDWRFGIDPRRAKRTMSDEDKAKTSERLKGARLARSLSTVKEKRDTNAKP